jgi:two-component system, NtrC family, sensor kinase
MQLESILAIIICSVLRKKLRSKTLYPKWDNVLQSGIAAGICLIVVPIIFKASNVFALWLGHVLVFGLVYMVFTKKEFHFTKPFMYSLFPMIIISFVIDVVELINKDFYNKWENVFDIALLFSQILGVALWLINRKQMNTLEKERLKLEAVEKENKIIEKIRQQLELEVADRTTALIAQKEELEKTLTELKATQNQLIQSEKMASLGELTAGIAHEIQNPLNFVNNFSEVSGELLAEMVEELNNGNTQEAKEIVKDVQDNLAKILHHGKRADSIVKGMLQHSRSNNNAKKESTNINALADEYLRLAYHGLRAKTKTFNATLNTNFDESIKNINIIPQDIGRVILNVLTNAFYATQEKKEANPEGYEPTVSVSTKRIENKIELKITDNGNGIPQKLIDKIFQPFFTTKPTGQGTGLGLSLSYDIVKAHGGELKVETKEGEGSEFIIQLPVV